MSKVPKGSKLLHMLLLRLYWAAAAIWIAILLIGALKQDGQWVMNILEELTTAFLCVFGIGFIHWVVLYRKEIKK